MSRDSESARVCRFARVILFQKISAGNFLGRNINLIGVAIKKKSLNDEVPIV